MPSAHYATIAALVEENIKLLSDTSGETKLENRPLLNICSAILALSDALQDEFIHIDTRMSYIEQHLSR